MTWDQPEIDGVVHAAKAANLGTLASTTAVSGDTSISVSGGHYVVQVALTTIPATWGRRAGNPPYYYGLGYVSFGFSGAVVDQSDLHFADQFFWPKSAYNYTIAVHLNPGVSGTVYVYNAVDP